MKLQIINKNSGLSARQYLTEGNSVLVNNAIYKYKKESGDIISYFMTETGGPGLIVHRPYLNNHMEELFYILPKNEWIIRVQKDAETYLH